MTTNATTLFSRLRGLLLRPWAILVISVAIAALLISSRPERPTVSLPEKAWPVSTIEVEHDRQRPELQLYGKVEAALDAGLTAGIESDVLEVAVRDGVAVAQGDLLVRLDDRDARLVLAQREAEVQEISAQVRLEQQRQRRNQEALTKERELLELSESNAERARTLFSDGLLSQSDVDTTDENLKKQQLSFTSRQLSLEESEIRTAQLRAQLRRAEALRDQAQLEVDRSRLVAPFDGVVSDVEVSLGDRVQPGDPLLRIHNPDSVEVRAQLPSRYAGDVRRALAAELDMPARLALDGEYVAASLERIAGQTRTGSGSVEVFLALDSAGSPGRLGATVTVALAMPPVDDVIAVPAEALYGRDRLYIVRDGRLQSVKVTRLGEKQLGVGGTGVIVSGDSLSDGDQVVTTKISSATDGLLVDVLEVTRLPDDGSAVAVASGYEDPAL